MLLFSLLCGCSETTTKNSILWSGFHYEWENLSHRISLVHTQLHDDGSTTMGMIGGDWSTGDVFSDTLGFRMHMQEISDPYFRTINGETTLLLSSDEPATQDININEESVGMVLRGMHITTDIPQLDDYPDNYNPAHGYTAEEISFTILPDIDSHTASLTAQIDWSPQDREAMNNAMELAQTEVTLYWAQIIHQNPPEIQEIEIETPLLHEPPYSEHDIPAQELVHDATTATGIRSFSLALKPQEGNSQGSYWRELGIEITPSETGSTLSLRASNSSLLEEEAVTFVGSATIEYHHVSSRTHYTLSNTHDVGSFDFASPIAP